MTFFLLEVIFALMAFISHADAECRTLCLASLHHKRLVSEKAIISKNEKASSEPNFPCELRCYLEAECVAINIITLSRYNYRCELLRLDRHQESPNAFIEDENSVYYELKYNPCRQRPCRFGMCQAGFDGSCESYRCVCNRGFTGRDCTEGCDQTIPLGMESGAISDSQVSSSSVYGSDGSLEAKYGRLGNTSAWAARGFGRQWLQVDLGTSMRIQMIATQGHPKQSLAQWVTSYKLMYTDHVSSPWATYTRNGTEVTFPGNTNYNEVQTNTLDPPGIVARYVRVAVQTWRYWIAMRLELYGCSLVD